MRYNEKVWFKSMWEDFWTDLLRLLPQFVATISGVFLAFSLDRAIDWINRRRDRKKLLRNLHTELVETKTKLFPKTQSVVLLYPDMWDSAISSGATSLLSSDQIVKLAKVYRYIKGTHYEAEWVRRAIEEFNNVPRAEKEKKQWLRIRYEELWDRHFNRGKDLSNRIESILREKWWDS
jgi:hypothetical protein